MGNHNQVLKNQLFRKILIANLPAATRSGRFVPPATRITGYRSLVTPDGDALFASLCSPPKV